MADFSGLPYIVLALTRIISIFLSGLVVLVMGILYWQRHAIAKTGMLAEDWRVMAVLAVVALAGFAIAYFIGREMKRTKR